MDGGRKQKEPHGANEAGLARVFCGRGGGERGRGQRFRGHEYVKSQGENKHSSQSGEMLPQNVNVSRHVDITMIQYPGNPVPDLQEE